MVVLSKMLARESRRFSREYELCHMIGRGSFGEVWKCSERSSGNVCAVKLVDKGSLRTHSEREDLQREIAVLEAFRGQHEGVVQLKDVLEGETVVQVVMELCSGGDLFELLKNKGCLPEEAARYLFRQMSSALSFCHSFGVIHRDIKPENILLDRPALGLYDVYSCIDEVPPVKAKLADFGLAAVLGPGPDATTSGYTGSRYYTAPEMLKCLPYGRAADVWSMGVVLCTMLTGRLPFAGHTKHDIEGLRRVILRGRINFQQPQWERVSDTAKHLVCRMLEVDPKTRITAEEVLAHPWLATQQPDAVTLTEDELARSLTVRQPRHISQSLPASPVDTHRCGGVSDGSAGAAGMDAERPYASQGPEPIAEFQLVRKEHTEAMRIARESGGESGPCVLEEVMESVDLDENCTQQSVRGRRNNNTREEVDRGVRGGLASVAAVDSWQPFCCTGPFFPSELSSPGVWCLPQAFAPKWFVCQEDSVQTAAALGMSALEQNEARRQRQGQHLRPMNMQAPPTVQLNGIHELLAANRKSLAY